MSTRTVPGRLSMMAATRSTSSLGHDPEHDGLGLVGGEGGDHRQRGPGGEPLHGGGGRVVRRHPLHQTVDGKVLRRPAGRAAPPVERFVAGDGEHPSPERRLGTPEALDAADHAEPRLGGEILGGSRRDNGEVPQHAGLQVVPEPSKGFLVAAGGRAEHLRELGADHRRLSGNRFQRRTS